VKFEWTDETVTRTLEMWISGKSGTDIANILTAEGREITRSAVLGKLHRIGAMKPDATRRKATPPKTNNAVKVFPVPRPEKPKLAPSYARGFKRPKLKLVVAGNGALLVIPPPVHEPRAYGREVDASVAIAPRVWTSRKFGECAFPVDGEGADTRSCCNPTAKTYCNTHARVMRGDMPKSWAGFAQPNFARKVA
jgi:GcrA cell cycle regulator